MPRIKHGIRAKVSGRQTPAQEGEQASIMSVALAQPHRGARRSRSRRAPLGGRRRLRLRDELYRAGASYGVVSRSAKIALGMRVDGVAEGHGSVSDEQQIARDRLARQRYDEAVRVLRRVSPFRGAPRGPLGRRHLTKGLDALANFWGMIDRGIPCQSRDSRSHRRGGEARGQVVSFEPSRRHCQPCPRTPPSRSWDREGRA